MTQPAPIPLQPPIAQRLESIAAHMRAGGLAILPTETVYGLAASGASDAAIALLRTLTARPPADTQGAPPPTHTWHALDHATVIWAFSIRSPLQRRLLQTLTPGPVRCVTRRPISQARAMAESIGFRPGVLESPEGDMAVRIPDLAETRRIIELVKSPVVIERVSAAMLGGLPLADARHPSAADIQRASDAGIETLDLGPARLGKPSTTIRLLDSGGYSILSEGAIDTATIRKRIERVILMVCTGNTCRSPMARAIAQHMLTPSQAAAPSGIASVPTSVLSAGVAAFDGDPMTPEAREALSEMGINAGPHRSASLTRAMVNDADAIFAMTRQHRDAIIAMNPSMAAKVKLLDPAGGDVPDPIGGPIQDYRQTARALQEMIRQRLNEIAGSDQR